MTTDETPRTEAGSGMIRWTLAGPVRLEVDSQSGQTHIYYEAAAPAGQPLDMERLREHEPEPPLVSDRWDCSCGWHQRPAVAQDWITHVLARLAESSERP